MQDFSGKRRVAVTGAGCVTPFGVGRGVLFDSLLAGKSAVSLISSFDTSDFKTKIAAEIKNFDPVSHFPKSETRKMDRVTQLAAVAAKDAVLDSGIKLETLDRSRYLRFCIQQPGSELAAHSSDHNSRNFTRFEHG